MSLILFVVLFVSRKVPESGNYTFFVARDDNCELWLQPERVELVEKNEGRRSIRQTAPDKTGLSDRPQSMGQVRIHCHLINGLGSPENQTALRRKTLYPL